MSTNLLESPGLTVTRFHGGIARGVCVQIDTGDGTVQLTHAQVCALMPALSLFLTYSGNPLTGGLGGIRPGVTG
jgi:hypothetical protein